MMGQRKIVVVGGGASGMTAAVTAARKGAEVTVVERNDRVGKKLLSTGNGKCNLSNRKFDMDCYHSGHKDLLPSFFDRFGPEDTVRFFESMGMLVREKGGGLYPYSEQASTVLDCLRDELSGCGVRVLTGCRVKDILAGRNGFELTGDKETAGDGKREMNVVIARADAVILACGGFAAPGTGSDGSGAALARRLGHHLIPSVPALVQLKCKEDYIKTAAGVRSQAALTLLVEGRAAAREEGELQITDYGISGIPTFQLSRSAAYALRDGRKTEVAVDFFPGCGGKEFRAISSARIEKALRCGREKTLEEFLLGLCHKKVNLMVIKALGFRPGDTVRAAGAKGLERLLAGFRNVRLTVVGTNPFAQAQVSAGGVALSEVDTQLQSKKVPGLYMAGELLDVDGRCGGYNLQWAWTSGAICGSAAALGEDGSRPGQGGPKVRTI